MPNPLYKVLSISALFICFLLNACTRHTESAPSEPSQKPVVKTAPIVGKTKIYLENSGSINGYLYDGNTIYRQALTNVLWGIFNNDSFGDTRIEANLINNQVYPTPLNGVLSFVNSLVPNTPPFRVGNTNTSDFNLMLENILQKHNPNDVSVFISDCIYSGNNLILQQQNTKGLFQNKIRRLNNFTVTVIQVNADFNGMYYCAGIRPRRKNNERPLYIWFMGAQPLIKSLFKTLKPEEIPGYKSYYTLSAQQVTSPQYTTSSLYGSGRYKVRHRDAIPEVMDIIDRSNFQFTLPVVLPNDLFPRDYLTDTSNYQLNIPQLKVVRAVMYNDREVLLASRANHLTINNKVKPNYLLYVKALKPFPNGQLNVQLMNKQPKWVKEVSTLNAEESSDPNKTFGFNYLMNGLTQAFYYAPTPVVTFPVNLN